MGSTHALVAYKANFKFLERNNPHIDKYKESISKGERPNYTTHQFIDDYQKYVSELADGESANKSIQLKSSEVKIKEMREGITKICLTPSAGKKGVPFKIYNSANKQEQAFSADSVALYRHLVYMYSTDDHLLLVFHRMKGSGCKSVFLETANDMLRTKGLRLEMTIVFPTSDSSVVGNPTMISLIQTVNTTSSDIAENLGGKRKKPTFRKKLILNLGINEQSSIKETILSCIRGEINSDSAFALIKCENSEYNNYDSAEIALKIGRRSKNVRLNDLLSVIGSYDITHLVETNQNDEVPLNEKIEAITDEYYFKIKDSGNLDYV